MDRELIEREVVGSIVGAFFEVYNYFGPGLAEAAYSGALDIALRERGHQVARELRVAVSYRGHVVARQRLDMVVDEKVVVESKASEKLPPSAQPQLLSYLRATPFPVGLLLHFGPTPTFQRFVDWPKRQRE